MTTGCGPAPVGRPVKVTVHGLGRPIPARRQADYRADDRGALADASALGD